MRIKEIKKIENHEKAYQLIKEGKIKFNCPVLILHQNTGLYFTRPLVVEGKKGECLYELMDKLFNQYNIDEIPFPLYSFDDVIDDIKEIGYPEYLYEHYFPLNGGEYSTDTILELGYLEYLYEHYFPLNDGEYYTDTILEIEEVI